MNPDYRSLPKACLVALQCLALSLPALAQQSTSSASRSLAPREQEETILLSPLVVESDKDKGYIATDTLAGSRFGTKLDETPASISVLTADFLNDIGAFDLTSALRYASNIEMDFDDNRSAVNGQQTVRSYQSYRVRGLASTVARNYFAWNLPSDTYNVDRVEDSRGPNSVLFGIANPGGLVNVMTKKAQLKRSFRNLYAAYGSYDTHRFVLDVNQMLLSKKLALRVNAVDSKRNTFRNWAFTESRIAYLTASYQIIPRLMLTAEVEFGTIKSNSPRTYTLYDSFSLWLNSGRPTYASYSSSYGAKGVGRNSTAAASPRVTVFGNDNSVYSMRSTMTTSGDDNLMLTDTRIADDSINGLGPGPTRESRFHNITAYLDYKIAHNTFLQLGYNHQEHRFERYDPGQNASTVKGDPNQKLPSGAANPYAGLLCIDTGPFTYTKTNSLYDIFRATLSTRLDTKNWGKYQAGVYAEYVYQSTDQGAYDEMWLDDKTGKAAFNTGTPESANNAVYRRRYIKEYDWASYYVDGPNRTGLYRNITDPTNTGRTLSGAWVGRSTAGIYDYNDETLTVMIMAQARYFNDRLILSGGIRRDEDKQRQVGTKRDPVTNQIVQAASAAESLAGTSYTRRTIKSTKTAGFVYKMMPALSFIGNYADNIQPRSNSSTFVMPASGEPGALVEAETPKGVGRDIGLRLSLFNGAISLRAVFFETQSKNNATTFSTGTIDTNTRILDALNSAGRITRAEYDKRMTVAHDGLFDYESTGYEFELTANPTRYLRIRANYSITNPIQSNIYREWIAWDKQNVQWLSTVDTSGIITVNNRTIPQEIAYYQDLMGESTASDGVGTLGNRRDKVSVFTRLDLACVGLRGAYIGGGYRHQSKMFTGVGSAGQSIYSNSYWRADVMAGYALRLKNKFIKRITLQLDVDNVFNEHDPLITRYRDDSLAVKRLVVQAPITWQLSANIDF